MSPSPLSPPAPSPVCAPSSLWHQSRRARDLLAGLGPADVRLALARGGPGPDRLVWCPAGAFGAATFDALAGLREAAVGPAFAMARDDCARAAALVVAQSAPSVAGAVAGRFGDPDRWLGHGPVEATRRFRANWI